jgi:hypothetical protein
VEWAADIRWFVELGAEGEWQMMRQFPARPWTPAEEERLRALVMAGMSAIDLSPELQRSVAAVRSRSEQLGISLKLVTVRRPGGLSTLGLPKAIT